MSLEYKPPLACVEMNSTFYDVCNLKKAINFEKVLIIMLCSFCLLRL